MGIVGDRTSRPGSSDLGSVVDHAGINIGLRQNIAGRKRPHGRGLAGVQVNRATADGNAGQTGINHSDASDRHVAGVGHAESIGDDLTRISAAVAVIGSDARTSIRKDPGLDQAKARLLRQAHHGVGVCARIGRVALVGDWIARRVFARSGRPVVHFTCRNHRLGQHDIARKGRAVGFTGCKRCDRPAGQNNSGQRVGQGNVVYSDVAFVGDREGVGHTVAHIGTAIGVQIVEHTGFQQGNFRGRRQRCARRHIAIGRIDGIVRQIGDGLRHAIDDGLTCGIGLVVHKTAVDIGLGQDIVRHIGGGQNHNIGRLKRASADDQIGDAQGRIRNHNIRQTGVAGIGHDKRIRQLIAHLRRRGQGTDIHSLFNLQTRHGGQRYGCGVVVGDRGHGVGGQTRGGGGVFHFARADVVQGQGIAGRVGRTVHNAGVQGGNRAAQ